MSLLGLGTCVVLLTLIVAVMCASGSAYFRRFRVFEVLFRYGLGWAQVAVVAGCLFYEVTAFTAARLTSEQGWYALFTVFSLLAFITELAMLVGLIVMLGSDTDKRGGIRMRTGSALDRAIRWLDMTGSNDPYRAKDSSDQRTICSLSWIVTGESLLLGLAWAPWQLIVNAAALLSLGKVRDYEGSAGKDNYIYRQVLGFYPLIVLVEATIPTALVLWITYTVYKTVDLAVIKGCAAAFVISFILIAVTYNGIRKVFSNTGKGTRRRLTLFGRRLKEVEVHLPGEATIDRAFEALEHVFGTVFGSLWGVALGLKSIACPEMHGTFVNPIGDWSYEGNFCIITVRSYAGIYITSAKYEGTVVMVTGGVVEMRGGKLFARGPYDTEMYEYDITMVEEIRQGSESARGVPLWLDPAIEHSTELIAA